ncbi:hypothetical protein [Enterovibrio baiacu]|uniref:hypothetical protein n=1 Tax=Enterovibrio baiacu TaxID=2491023 RepID=UPI001012812F|nr:hypothetical protein [Enterovibrio baiacu]MBE1275096.1 hypothetical protein [Enterovibrio baiacu]
MNIQEQLALYRQRFGIEREQAKQEVDPFETSTQQQQQEAQAQTQSTDDLFANRPSFEGVTVSPKEGYNKRLENFALEADKDPILSRDQEKLTQTALRLRGIVNDPSNPIDKVKGEEILKKIIADLNNTDEGY